MFGWEDCEALVKASRTDPSLRVEYKFGPRTTIRRNKALAKRKELKANRTVDKAFIKFPALLMGKKAGEAKYRVIEDFSDAEVTLKKLQNRRNFQD